MSAGLATTEPQIAAAEQKPVSALQRRCACGGIVGQSGECAHCQARRIARAGRRSATSAPDHVAIAPRIVHDVLGRQGQALGTATRKAMEASFGHDFSQVRVHAGPAAAESARAVGARAYTVGSDVVFDGFEFDPSTARGQRLLAHELAHVVQESGGNASIPGSRLVVAPEDTSVEREADVAAERVVSGARAGTAPRSCTGLVVHRSISPRFGVIRDRLTYGFLDWAITDTNANDVLQILKTLSDVDLADTVAAMEREGLVDRLFDNVSEDDKGAEEDTLQKVQNARVFTRTSRSGETSVTLTTVGSCSPERASVLGNAIGTALGWLDAATARLNEFVALPLSRRGRQVSAALHTHFHTSSVFHGGLVGDRLRTIRTRIGSSTEVRSECAAPTDPVCSALAAAYVHQGSVIRWCPTFFDADADWQAQNIIHESAHAFLGKLGQSPSSAGDVQDRGYFSERVYEYLRPEEAMDNADSYAQLAQMLGSGRAPTPEQEGRPQDSLADCPANAREIVRPALARAARWNLNAVNVLADARPDFRAGYAGLRRTHFGSDDPVRIRDLLEVYQAATKELNRDVPFECEAACGVCAGSTIGYYRSFIFTSSVLHLCPRWFGQSEQARIETIYALVLSHDADVAQADCLKYVGLARDLTTQYWSAPAALPTEPFPTTTMPGATVA